MMTSLTIVICYHFFLNKTFSFFIFDNFEEAAGTQDAVVKKAFRF